MRNTEIEDEDLQPCSQHLLGKTKEPVGIFENNFSQLVFTFRYQYLILY